MPQKYGSKENFRDKAEKKNLWTKMFRRLFREHVFFWSNLAEFQKKSPFATYLTGMKSHEISVYLMQKPSHFATLGGSDPLIP